MTVFRVTRRSPLRSRRRVVAVMLATALVTSACGGANLSDANGVSQTTDGAAPSTAAPALQDINAEEFLAVLSAAGVAIVDTEGAVIVDPTEPAGPVQLTKWQAAAMAREAALGVGIASAELDALIGEPIPGAALSSILAGYLVSAETPGAAWSARLIGPVDLESATEVDYPTAVLVLFVAELTRPESAGAVGAAFRNTPGAVRAVYREGQPAPSAIGVPSIQVPVVGQVCGMFIGQVGAMLEEVFTFLALNPPLKLPDWLTAAGLAAIKSQLIAEWSTYIPDVVKAMSVLLMVSLVTAVVGSWSMSVSPSASSDRFSVGPEGPRAQTFTANLAASPAWPPDLDECATTAGIDLPDPTGAGTAVTWAVSGLPQFGAEDQRDLTFDGQGLARLSWHTGHEDSDAGQVQIGVVTATVQPDPAFRESLVKTAAAALQQLVNQSGPLFGGINVVLPDASEIVAAAGLLIAQNASAEVEVQYHTEDCLTGSWVSLAYRATGQDTMGGVETVTMVFSDPRNGSVTFDPGAPVYSRAQGPDDLWVKMELEGSYTFTVSAGGAIKHTGGNAYLTPYVDLGDGWIQTSTEPLLITEGGMGSLATSTFKCSGTTLIVSSPFSEFEFGKTD